MSGRSGGDGDIGRGRYTSTYSIDGVLPADGGKYSCRPSSDATLVMPEAEVNLHVVNGKLGKPELTFSTGFPTHCI